MFRNRFLGGVSHFALFAPDLGGSEAVDATPAPAPSLPDAGPVDARTAATAISEWRAKQGQAEPPPKEEQPRVNGRFVSADAQQSPLEGADAAADTPSGEEDGAEAVEQPPIEPPNSWTKAEKERFASLPRETQEYLAERESARDADINRRQREAADRTKALEAKEQAAEQARQQYETAAQNALSVLQQQQAHEFSDIKTHADVLKLATDDPFRFAQWQARQMQITAQAQEVDNLNRQRQEQQSRAFEVWAKEQDAKFEKMFPEITDKEKSVKLRDGLSQYLTKEVGVPENALSELRNNSVFRDAMFQRVLYDGYRFHAAQQAAKSAVAAPKPQVQRPGAAPQKGANFQQEIAAAQDRLKNAKGIEATETAANLMRLQRRAARR